MPTPKKPKQRLHRVNARLDGDVFAQLAELEEYTKLSTTNVVREALRRMHADVSAAASRNRGTLDRIVGKYTSDEADLSTTYKDVLSRSLAKKHKT